MEDKILIPIEDGYEGACVQIGYNFFKVVNRQEYLVGKIKEVFVKLADDKEKYNRTEGHESYILLKKTMGEISSLRHVARFIDEYLKKE